MNKTAFLIGSLIVFILMAMIVGMTYPLEGKAIHTQETCTSWISFNVKGNIAEAKEYQNLCENKCSQLDEFRSVSSTCIKGKVVCGCIS